MNVDPVPAPQLQPAPVAKPNALWPALLAVVLPLAAFALAWAYAGTVPMAVPKAEWGTWMIIGTLLGIASVAGLVFTFKAFVRGGRRTMAVAGLLLNLVLLLVAWAGLFA
jgi:hypothetical protein